MPSRDWRVFIDIQDFFRTMSESVKISGSGGSMVARLKLKGIDGRAPPGVEPAA